MYCIHVCTCTCNDLQFLISEMKTVSPLIASPNLDMIAPSLHTITTQSPMALMR